MISRGDVHAAINSLGKSAVSGSERKCDCYIKSLKNEVILWGYHPSLKLSGIPTFPLIVSLTHSMDNI